MPSHRIPSPDLAAGTVGSHRGWVKLTLVALVAAQLAEIRHCKLERIGEITSRNFEMLFKGVLR